MKNMWKKIFSVLKNKYVISTLALFVWLMFFDKNDFFSQMELRHRLKLQEQNKKYYTEEIARITIQNANMLNNMRDLEKFGRENYLMKRDSEDIYLIVRDTAVVKSHF